MSTIEISSTPIQSYGAVIAHYFPEEKQVKFLAVERDLLTSKYNGGKLQNVMGKPEEKDNDDPIQTAIREADEEISKDIEIIPGETYFHTHKFNDPDDKKRGTTYMAEFFLARLVDDSEIELDKESSRAVWLAEEQLDEYEFAPGSKEAIKELAKHARSYFNRRQIGKPIELLDLTTPYEVIIQLHGEE